MELLLPWSLAAAFAVATLFSLSFALRERRRRKGRPLIDRSPVRQVSVAEVDPIFDASETGPSRDSEVALIGDLGARASTSTTEAWILCALAKRCRTIFEFGTCTGRTTYLLARNAPAEATVATITLTPDTADAYQEDPHDMESARWARVAKAESVYDRFHYEGSDVAPKIRQLFGDSKVFDESPWQGACDLVFVDGSHAYSYVRNDSEKALAMIRPGGHVVWHDFSPACPGVWRYLSELGRTLPLLHVKGTTLVIYRAGDDPAS